MSDPPLPERVVLHLEEGATRELSIKEFGELALPDRIRLLMQNRVQFFAGDSALPTHSALGALRKSGLT